jgi:tripartite ATP-independent transporter DctP family solute receptor
MTRTLIAGAAMVLLGAGVAGAETLKFAWQLPLGNYASRGAERLAACIGDKSGGSITMETYPAGQLYKAKELYEASRSGAVDMAMFALGTFSTTDPTAEVVYLPFLVSDQAQMRSALDGVLGAHLDGVADKFGVKILGYFAGSGGQFGTREKALRTPADFKGQKIRVPGAVPAEVVKNLGGTPATVAAAEVYLALQRGTVDGTNFPLTSFYDRKLYEVVKYLTLAKVSLDPDVVVINKAAWGKLDSAGQAAITGCAAEAETWVASEEERIRNEYVGNLRDKGMEVIDLTADERKLWRAATEPIVKAFVEKNGPDSQKLVDALAGGSS